MTTPHYTQLFLHDAEKMLGAAKESLDLAVVNAQRDPHLSDLANRIKALFITSKVLMKNVGETIEIAQSMLPEER